MKTEQTLSTEAVTANSEQLAILKSNFPQCFDRQGKFILSKLQEILQANSVDASRESYSLNWLGKSYARVLANEPIRTMLSEDIPHNSQEQNKNSHNLLIQGDNLEVLKHLKGAYTDKIKMIYIDPPYNTGSDGFVYQDDRSFTPEQFAELAGVDLEEAKRVLDFTQSNANSHSAWLTFIYPRLYIAKQLLKDDGMIFISIDENEQATLRILADEIFGEANFCGEIVWKNSSKNDQKYISMQHEYILCYVKSKDKNKGDWLEKKEGIDEIYAYFDKLSKKHGTEWDKIHNEALNWYKQFPPSNPIYDSKHYNYFDANGVYFASDLSGPNFGQYRYDVIHPVTNKVCKEPASGWRFPQETMLEKIEKGLIHFGRDETTIPNNKTYLKDTEFQSLTSIKFRDGRVASNLLKSLFGIKDIFTNPKDVGILIDLFKAIQIENKDFVLDFFAGSGSTAHALMEYNLINKISSNFICVQLDEKTNPAKAAYKAGYNTIFEITKNRIIKASEKLAQEYPKSNFERGFKIFKTCNNFLPEIKIKQLTLNYDELKTPSHTHQVDLNFTEKLVNNDFSDAQLQDILTTWKGLDKILLSENLNKISLGDYPAYGFGHVLYLVNKGFNTNALKELLQKLDDEHTFQVSKIVMLGHNIDSKSQREIDEAMKNYNNKKSIPVDVVVRY